MLGLAACSSDETERTIPVTGVTLNENALTLTVGKTGNLKATVLPENATNLNVVWNSSNTAVATITQQGVVTAVSAGETTITVTTVDGEHKDEAVVTVEGVLINGVIWATRNLDYPGTFAPYPHSAGRFFQWGTLDGETHHWPTTGVVTGWNSSTNRIAWTTANDPCPQGWRVPTETELNSLLSHYSWITNWNDTGVDGRLFGTAPNQVFFPALSRRDMEGTLALSFNGLSGHYWSNTPCPGLEMSARQLFFESVFGLMLSPERSFGMSIRCVVE